MGILNDGAGDEVPTKVLLAEATLTAFVIIGLSPAFTAIRVGLSSKGVAQLSTVVDVGLMDRSPRNFLHCSSQPTAYSLQPIAYSLPSLDLISDWTAASLDMHV